MAAGGKSRVPPSAGPAAGQIEVVLESPPAAKVKGVREMPSPTTASVAMIDERDATTIKARSAKHKRTQIAINKGAV